MWAYHTIPRPAAMQIAKLVDKHNWKLGTTVGRITYWRKRTGQALGDNLNDLPMFARASTSVALSNAPKVVKQKVTTVTPSNDQEVIAGTLLTFGLA